MNRTRNALAALALCLLACSPCAAPDSVSDCTGLATGCAAAPDSPTTPGARLQRFAGSRWLGSSELWIDPSGNAASTSAATLVFENGGISYTWAFRGTPQTGRFSIAENTLSWQDSWHQPQPVRCKDTGDRRSLFAVEYSYPAGDGPDWHWRMRLSQRPDDSLVLQMTNITPWGEEARAVRMVLRGAAESADTSPVPTRFAPEQLQQDGRVTLSPGFTPDGSRMYFAQSDCSPIWECPQSLKRADRIEEGWSTPVSVPLPRTGRVDWPTVSPDGNTLIFSWSAERAELANLDIYENFDLYTLDLTDPAAVPVPIRSGDINRPRAGSLKKLRYMHNESLPSLTRAGSLYFMTERPDGIGERDIYVARAGAGGLFESAVPVPGPVNSPGRDDGVWVDADETVMLLSYADRGGEGGADLFISHNTDAGWSSPQNLGPVINSEYAEFGARLTPDGRRIVFTSDRPFDGQKAGLLQVWSAAFSVANYR